MSKYTYEYLAKNVKASTFGGTRLPWWAKGDEPCLYPGPIPFEDVQAQLASWEPSISRMLDEDLIVQLVHEGWAGPDLIEKMKEARVASHKLIKTDEGSGVIGIEHALHLYGVWLTGTIAEVLGDDAVIVSSGLLDNKMQAWVCIERPEVVDGPGGVQFAPNITFSTSLNGTLSSQINQSTTLPICDNTMTLARSQGLAFKHTGRSGSKLGTYRGVAQALVQGQTDFTKILDDLLSTEVTDKDYSNFLDALFPESDEDTPRKRNRSQRVKQDITQLYKGDHRVQAWKGTAFGVVQAVNTYQQHLSQLRNTTGYEMDDTNLRAMRNYGERMKNVRGETADEHVVRVLRDTLAGNAARKTLVTR